mmetsp:Transcript_26353/g.69943  ORF Transcript_26353/g.69943 Transcript_26353/m.69943 type:complete len:570 (-) Transcript_26353:108-1817(-)
MAGPLDPEHASLLAPAAAFGPASDQHQQASGEAGSCPEPGLATPSRRFANIARGAAVALVLLACGLLSGRELIAAAPWRVAPSAGRVQAAETLRNSSGAVAHITDLWEGGCSWLGRDNCQNQDKYACRCRSLNLDGPCTPCPDSKPRPNGCTCRQGDRPDGKCIPCPKSTPQPSRPEKPKPTPQPAMQVIVERDEPTTARPTTAAPTTARPTTAAPAPAAQTPGRPAADRKGSFLVIGDWGFDAGLHGNVGSVRCQQAIADKMLKKMEELGDVQFVINVGDSFYPHGVTGKGDPQWFAKWRNIYDEKLRSVPWYSVYGNHDFQHDPGACSAHPTDGAQINGDIDNKDFFYMPDYSWFIDHPELDLEVIALEMNHFESGGQEAHFWDCRLTPCEKSCKEHANTRAVQSLRLFHNRLVDSKRKNFLVFSHYPTDHFSAAPHFMAGLRNSSNRHITYFGGHVHDVRQGDTTSIHPNVNWLSGGGGGWGCDGNNLGFVVGEISRDSKVSTYPELVDKQVCCGSKPKLEWKGGDSCSWLSSDNCINTDHIACSCRQKNPDGPCTPCPNSHKREP